MNRRALAIGIAVAALAPRPATACPGGLTATMVDSVDSRKAVLGEPFRFKLLESGELLGTKVRAGTLGYGFVRWSNPAASRARDGDVALEPRYLVLGKRKLQVAIDPISPVEWSPRTTLVQKGIGRIPLPVPGLALSAINTLRHGRNVVIGPGTKFGIVGVPDLAQDGVCDAG